MPRNRGPIDKVGRKEDTYKTVSSLPLMQAVPASDVIYPETLLYIEGIQVPFTAISISSTYNGMPQASIEIPYFPGLQEILKGYFPKVHIFFYDYRMDKYQNYKGEKELDVAELRRLLFSGVIIGAQYSKRKSTTDASMSLTFRCVHKYYPMSDILFKFGSRGAEQVVEQDSGAVAGLVSMNSAQAMQAVVGGVTDPTDGEQKPVSVETARDCSINHLTPNLKNYHDRLQGIPGIAVAIWNLMKRDTFLFKENARIMTDIYIPLIDSGLRPFERMSGHPVVEGTVDGARTKIAESAYAERAKGAVLKPSDKLGTADMLVPPGFKNFLGEAASVDIAILVTQTGLQYMGELSNVWSFVSSMLRSLDYDLETLASPIQRTDGPAIDLVSKPLLPFFFSPVCNVLLPNLWDSLTLNDDSISVPTRVTAQGSLNKAAGSTLRELEYRGPHEVREAVAYLNPNSHGTLGSTTMFVGEFPAIHEFGRGVRVKRIDVNRWVSLLGASYGKGTGKLNSSEERRIITTDSTVTWQKEDLKNEARVWKYWPGGTASKENKKDIPYYTLDPDKNPGYDMEYGKAGKPGATAAAKISQLRTTTSVPKFWNVVYFPDDESFAVFPPHYDYVREEWWMTKAMHDNKKWVGVLNVRHTDQAKAKEAEAAVPLNYTKPTNAEKAETTTAVGNSQEATLPKVDADLLEKLRVAWNNEPGHEGDERLNPYELRGVNECSPYEVTLFSLVDYQAGLSLVETRTATVSGSFNPYVIPGYPMDVVDAATDSASLHGFCVSVSHSITASSIETSYSLTSVMTYDEMRLYKLPSILPWFREQFGMWDSLSLIGQPDSVMNTANNYYLQTLGVGVADPTILEDADSGAANSVLLAPTGKLVLDEKDVFKAWGQGNTLVDTANPNLTYEGNLSLVRREIETQADIEEFSGIRFVDIANRSSLSPVENVKENPLFVGSTGKVRTTTTLPGYSAFLKYDDQIASLKVARDNLYGETNSKSQTQTAEKK